MRRTVILSIVSGAAALALLNIPQTRAVAQERDSAAIMEQFRLAEDFAQAAEKDADTLESYTRTRASWAAHGQQVNLIREHVNRLLATHSQLSDLRSEGSPWQQAAIDRVEPIVKDVADRLTATIQTLNENRNNYRLTDYHEYVRGNYQAIATASRLISDILDYGEAKAKAESLERDLGIAPSANLKE